MYIGEVSKKTGLTIKAIRFYEARGLIPAPARKGRYRFYSESDLELLKLIKEARSMGISLGRLKGVLVFEQGIIDWMRINTFLDDIKKEMQKDIQRLTAAIDTIEHCQSLIKTA